MTVPKISFEAPDDKLIGGKIVMTELISVDEFLAEYAIWLTAHPERVNEFSYDDVTEELDIGLWDIEVTCSTKGMHYGIVGSEPVVEEPPAPAVMNPVNLKDIMSAKPTLNVGRVHDKATMAEAKNLAAMTSIPTQGGMQSFGQNGTVSHEIPSNGVTAIQTKPGVTLDNKVKGRVVVNNMPARQNRQDNQPRETINMSKKHKHQDRGQQPDEPFQRAEFPRYSAADNRGNPRGNNRQSALTGGHPADPDLIAKLLQSGIGSAVTGVDTHSYIDRLKVQHQQNHRYYDEDFVDGQTCINVSTAANTELGKALRLSQFHPFEYPGIGHFNSLTGLFMFLTMNPYGSYSDIHANPANRELTKIHEWRTELKAVGNLTRQQAEQGAMGFYDFQSIYSIMADSLWMTVNQDPKLVAMLLENQLEFECYTWVKAYDKTGAESEEKKPHLRNDRYGMWYAPMLNEVAFTLKKRMTAFQKGVAIENLPVPDFRRVIDVAIKRQRKRMINEILRQEIGFAKVIRPAPTSTETSDEARIRNTFEPKGKPGAQQTPNSLIEHAKVVDAEMGIVDEPTPSVEDMVSHAKMLAREEQKAAVAEVAQTPVPKSYFASFLEAKPVAPVEASVPDLKGFVPNSPSVPAEVRQAVMGVPAAEYVAGDNNLASPVIRFEADGTTTLADTSGFVPVPLAEVPPAVITAMDHDDIGSMIERVPSPDTVSAFNVAISASAELPVTMFEPDDAPGGDSDGPTNLPASDENLKKVYVPPTLTALSVDDPKLAGVFEEWTPVDMLGNALPAWAAMSPEERSAAAQATSAAVEDANILDLNDAASIVADMTPAVLNLESFPVDMQYVSVGPSGSEVVFSSGFVSPVVNLGAVEANTDGQYTFEPAMVRKVEADMQAEGLLPTAEEDGSVTITTISADDRFTINAPVTEDPNAREVAEEQPAEDPWVLSSVDEAIKASAEFLAKAHNLLNDFALTAAINQLRQNLVDAQNGQEFQRLGELTSAHYELADQMLGETAIDEIARREISALLQSGADAERLLKEITDLSSWKERMSSAPQVVEELPETPLNDSASAYLFFLACNPALEATEYYRGMLKRRNEFSNAGMTEATEDYSNLVSGLTELGRKMQTNAMFAALATGQLLTVADLEMDPDAASVAVNALLEQQVMKAAEEIKTLEAPPAILLEPPVPQLHAFSTASNVPVVNEMKAFSTASGPADQS